MKVQTPNKDGLIMLRRVIDSDNSCLFNSIGFCMLDSKKKSDILRAHVKTTIKNNHEEYKDMLDKSLDEYLDWITESTSWGGGPELYILSKFFHSEMAVINVQTLNTTIYGEQDGYSQRIYLLYSGIHYDAITRNIYEDAEESSDIKIFDSNDKYAYEGALYVASELRKKKQFTNLKDFELICSVCFEGLKGMKEAQEHAKLTLHTNFAESNGFALNHN